MRWIWRSSWTFLPFTLIAACPAPTSSLARAQQTVQEFNLDTRFGGGDLVFERVAADARGEYVLHHRGWGGIVRVADVELAGMTPKGEHEINVLVRIAWYRE